MSDLVTEARRLEAQLAKQRRWIAKLFDDRRKVSAGVKFADSELVGIPLALVVGRGLANGLVEVRERLSGCVMETRGRSRAIVGVFS